MNYDLSDIDGLPESPEELRAWVGRLRALFRTWADMKAGGKPEEAFLKAGKLMTEIRAMLGMPTADEEIAAARATTSETEVVGAEQVAKSAKTTALTVDAVRAAKFARLWEKAGKVASVSNACDRLTMVKEGDAYTFTVDAGKLGEREFATVTDAVGWINAMPGGK